MPKKKEEISAEELAAIFPPMEPGDAAAGLAANGRTATSAAMDAADQDEGGVPGAMADGSPANLDLILDVDLTITVELGRARKRIRDVVALAPGSVVELDRLAGEAVDVLVNGKPVARGEVVVIGENFGVRITDIIGSSQRLRTALAGR